MGSATRRLIFSISGAHCSGKTTLFHRVLGELLSKGVPIVGTQESARSAHYLIAQNRDTPLHLEIAALQILEDVRAMRRGTSIILADRCLIDNLAYLQVRLRKKSEADSDLTKLIRQITREYSSLYSYVFVTSRNFTSEFLDPDRAGENTTPDEIAAEIRSLLIEFQVPHSPLPLKTSESFIVSTILEHVKRKKDDD
jgi:predicted ATPase